MAGILADVVVIVHFLFVLFVIFGALLLLKSWKFIWLHLPAAVWGALVEFTGWICPLTPLENRLRFRAGQDTYQGDFVENYIMPILYPEALTRNTQMILGSLVIVINIILYGLAFYRQRRPEI